MLAILGRPFRSLCLLVLGVVLSNYTLYAGELQPLPLIYEADFSGDMPGEWVQPPTLQREVFGTIHLEDGKLIITPTTHGHVMLRQAYEDAIFEFDFRLLAPYERPVRFFVRRGTGVVPWHEAAGYNVCLLADRVQFEVTPAINQPVAEFVFNEGADSYDWSQWHRFQVHAVANRIELFVWEKGEFRSLGAFTDETALAGTGKYPSGYFGLFAQTEAAMRNIRVFSGGDALELEKRVRPVRALEEQSQPHIWTGPTPFARDFFDETGGLWVHGVRPDYIEMMMNPELWPSVLAQTDVFRGYINLVTAGSYIPAGSETPVSQMRLTDDQLRSLINLIDEFGLLVSFEVGGARDYRPDTGIAAAERDFDHLKRWFHLGGAIDYLLTDHSMGFALNDWQTADQHQRGEYATAEKFLAGVFDQSAAYVARMQELIPNVGIGIIESLGYFFVHGLDGFSYSRNNPNVPTMQFAQFLDDYLDAMQRHGARVTSFIVDYNIQGYAADARARGGAVQLRPDGSLPEADALDFGRVLSVVQTVQERGLYAGVMIVPGRIGHGFFWNASVSQELRNRTASDVMPMVATGLLGAGARPDYLILTTWHEYPNQTGPEQQQYTVLHSFRRVLETEALQNLMGSDQ